MDINFSNIIFLDSWYFLLTFIVPIFLYVYYKKQKKGIKFQYFEELQSVFGKYSWNLYLKIFLLGAIFFSYILLFANPNELKTSEKIKKNGIDIVLALDISGSMEATDLSPSRIESAKKVIGNFVKKQKTNRIGLVVFSGRPFTSIPLSFDYHLIDESISRLKTEMISSKIGGTAIGDALLSSEHLFGKEKNREKVVILLTDGTANLGVDPEKAVLYLKEKNIKVYTIGIGSGKGGYITYNIGPFKKKEQVPPLDETSLKNIAKLGDGKYFKGESTKTLEGIFEELESLEKNDMEIDIQKKYKDRYKFFAFIISFLIFFFVLLEMRVWNK